MKASCLTNTVRTELVEVSVQTEIFVQQTTLRQAQGERIGRLSQLSRHLNAQLLADVAQRGLELRFGCFEQRNVVF